MATNNLIRFDTGGLDALAVELPKMGARAAVAMHDIITEGGVELREAWKRNATETAGQHGRLYPRSIESHLILSRDVIVEIGPNPNKPQGGMSFENGSVKQPPHNDGKRAADEVVPRLARRLDSALGLMGF